MTSNVNFDDSSDKRKEKEIVILGSGPMGFAIASIIWKNTSRFYLWVSDSTLIRKWSQKPVIELESFSFSVPVNMQFLNGYRFFRENSCVFIITLPSRQFEETMGLLFSHLSSQNSYDFILITKGFVNSHQRKKYGIYVFHQWILELMKNHRINGNVAILSGPSLLYDLIHKHHVFFEIATQDINFYETIKTLFHQPFVHVSFHDDMLSAELGTILKNPVSILTGMASSLPGCGSSVLGELAAKCFHEMLTFAKALGASEETLMKRSGLSDFMAAVFSPHSRNHQFGKHFVETLLQKPHQLSFWEQIQLFFSPGSFLEKEILSSKNPTDGAFLISPVIEIAREKQIEIPFYHLLYNILLRKQAPQDILSLLTKEPAYSRLPVLQKKKGIEHIASGRMMKNILKERMIKKISRNPGMLLRIRRQSQTIIETLQKRLEKYEKSEHGAGIARLKKELELWKHFAGSPPEEENMHLEALIEFYIRNIIDYYIPPLRTFLIYLVMPFRLLFGKFRAGSIAPFIGGHVKEVQELARMYPVFYAPTHKTHLDSVELGYALFFSGLPIPRVAAASVLMENPLWGSLLRALGAYVVDRENTKNILYLEILSQYTVIMLESGIPALAYIEGTRSRNGAFQPLKTGLLSTAIDAFRESGKEIVIVPVTISHEWIPEDLHFTNQEKKPSFLSYAIRRGRVYFDFGKPVFVSHFAGQDDPTGEIAKIILKEWKYHFRIQEHFIVSRVLYNHTGKDTKDILKKEIRLFVTNYPGSLVTSDVERIYKRGIASLKKRKIIKETQGGFEILNPYLLEFYSNMIPEFTVEDIDYIKNKREQL